MIITCEQCQTRFKVPDEKLAAGPVRMRCSKCNHVFTAGAEGTPTPQPMPAPPVPGLFRAPTPRPALTQPLFGAPGLGPPGNGAVPSFALPRTASTPGVDPFAPKPSTPPDPFGRARSSPVADPFANLGTPSKPFVSPAPAADPFAQIPTKVAGDPFASSTAAADPFAALGKPPPPADPFAEMSDQFQAPRAAVPDPFSSKPTTTGPDPFGSKPTTTGPDPFGVKAADPTTSTDPFSPRPTDPFASLARPAPTADPFSNGDLPPSAPTQAMADPFSGLQRPAASLSMPSPPSSDPFADLGGTPAPFGAPAPPLPAEAAADDDPFAGLSDEVDSNRFVFDPQANDAPPQQPEPASPSPASGPVPVAERPGSAPVARREADPAAPSRLAPVLRAAAVVVQAALFVVFLVVAVVLGRGGSVDRLLALDLSGALRGDDLPRALLIEELRVTRRHLPAGFDVVVVSGVVVHQGDAPHAGVRVQATFDDGGAASGWAWSDVNALDIADVASVDGVKALGDRKPKSPTLSPGDRAPFVIVARAPADDSQVAVTAVPE